MHEGGDFRVYGEADGLVGHGVRCFGETADGAIWLSTFERVFRFEGDRLAEVRAPDGTSLREVTCFHGDPEGAMWMGRLNDGLTRWRPGDMAQISITNGLPVRGVYDILPDARGGFWMASNRGIVRVEFEVLRALADGRRERFEGQLVPEADGLESVECPSGQQPIAARDEEGRLWFATMKGVAMIDPSQFRENPVTPPPRIEEVVYTVHSGGERGGSAVERRVEAPFPAVLELPPGSHRVEGH